MLPPQSTTRRSRAASSSRWVRSAAMRLVDNATWALVSSTGDTLPALTRSAAVRSTCSARRTNSRLQTQALLGAEHLDKRLGHLGEDIDARGLVIPRHQVALQGRHARALLALASEFNELTQVDRDLRATKTLQRS